MPPHRAASPCALAPGGELLPAAWGADAHGTGLHALWERDPAPGSARALCPCQFLDVSGHPLGMRMMGLLYPPTSHEHMQGSPVPPQGFVPMGAHAAGSTSCLPSSCSPALAHGSSFVQWPATCCCENRLVLQLDLHQELNSGFLPRSERAAWYLP